MRSDAEKSNPNDDPGENELSQRLFDFALRVVQLCSRLMELPGPGRVIAPQLLKAGTALGANYEEAQAAESRADFAHKVSIVLKEARESHYWLRLVMASKLFSPEKLVELVDEARQLKCIFGSLVLNARKGPKS